MAEKIEASEKRTSPTCDQVGKTTTSWLFWIGILVLLASFILGFFVFPIYTVQPTSTINWLNFVIILLMVGVGLILTVISKTLGDSSTKRCNAQAKPSK